MHSLQSDRRVPGLLKPALLRRLSRPLCLRSLETARSPCGIARESGCELAGLSVEDWASCGAEYGGHFDGLEGLCG